MGRAIVISDSSDDDSDNEDLPARAGSKYVTRTPTSTSTLDGFELLVQIVPRKRRAGDEKPTKAKKRRSGTKVSEKAKWKCKQCSLSFTIKSNLARHEKTAHFEKDKTKWKCQECGSHYSNKGNLRRHEKTAHSPKSAETDKSNLTACRLCDSNHSALDHHYEKHHSIKDVKDLLFDDGTVLVLSGPNTENGKATWFLNQKQKATQRLNALKCRLCEIETAFTDENQLRNHYIIDHKVDKDKEYLENVGHLFRMEKHTDGIADNGQSSLNDCHLCGGNFNPLSKHYGDKHRINDVEEMLFDNGNVLIISSTNTENGKAAWFLDQKKIAKQRLNNRKCRLCLYEPEFSSKKQLKHHYVAQPSYGGHHVRSEYLWKMKRLFRIDKSEAKVAEHTVNKSKKKVDIKMKSTDVQLNKALMQQQRHSEEESQKANDNEENRENPRNKMENILDYGVMKFCKQCNRSVHNFNAHIAAHETEAKKRRAASLRQENMSKSIGKDSVEDTITSYESDSASESNQESFTTIGTEAQINVHTKDNEKNNMEPVSQADIQELLPTLEGTDNKKDGAIQEDQNQGVSIDIKKIQELIMKELQRQLSEKNFSIE